MRRAFVFALLFTAVATVGAPKKRVEDRYTAPMQSEQYEISVKAPQTVTSGAPHAAVITITARGKSRLSSTPIKVETSAPSAVKFTLTQTAYAPEEADVSVYFAVEKPGTHELVIGVPVFIEGVKKPFLVPVPLSVTRELPASDAGR